RRWQDPEYRAEQSATRSATSKRLWQDPEYRAKHSAAMKRLWQDPEYRAKQSARTGRTQVRDSRGHFVNPGIKYKKGVSYGGQDF
ncbi:unnamed protein product, partial [marine sediment metagenome]